MLLITCLYTIHSVSIVFLLGSCALMDWSFYVTLNCIILALDISLKGCFTCKLEYDQTARRYLANSVEKLSDLAHHLMLASWSYSLWTIEKRTVQSHGLLYIAAFGYFLYRAYHYVKKFNDDDHAGESLMQFAICASYSVLLFFFLRTISRELAELKSSLFQMLNEMDPKECSFYKCKIPKENIVAHLLNKNSRNTVELAHFFYYTLVPRTAACVRKLAVPLRTAPMTQHRTTLKFVKPTSDYVKLIVYTAEALTAFFGFFFVMTIVQGLQAIPEIWLQQKYPLCFHVFLLMVQLIRGMYLQGLQVQQMGFRAYAKESGVWWV